MSERKRQERKDVQFQSASSVSKRKRRRAGNRVTLNISRMTGTKEELVERLSERLDLEEMQPDIVNRAESHGADLPKYEYAHALYCLPLRQTLLAFGRIEDYKALGVVDDPEQLDRTRTRRLESIGQRRGRSGAGAIGEQEDWMKDEDLAQAAHHAHVGSMTSIRGAVLQLRSAHTAAKHRQNELAIKRNEEKLANIKALAGTLVKLIKVGKTAVKFAANPMEATQELGKAARESSGITVEDIAILAIGEGADYMQLQTEIRRLVAENEDLVDQKVETDIEAALQTLAGWKLNLRAEEKRKGTYLKGARHNAENMARAAGGTDEDARTYLMAQAYFELSFFGRETKTQLTTMGPAWDNVYHDWLADDYARILALAHGDLARLRDGLDDEDLYLSNEELMASQAMALFQNIRRVSGEFGFITENVPAWESRANAWRSRLGELTGLDFKQPEKDEDAQPARGSPRVRRG